MAISPILHLFVYKQNDITILLANANLETNLPNDIKIFTDMEIIK